MNNQLSKNLQRLRKEKRNKNNKKQSLNRVNNTKKKNLKIRKNKIQIEEFDSTSRTNPNPIPKSLNDIPDNTKEVLLKILNRRKNIGNLHKLVKTSRSFKKVANEAKNLKEYEYEKNKLKLFRDILKSCKPNRESQKLFLKIISSLSPSARDQIFKFYRLNRKEHNIIEEIKRLLRIINRDAPSNFRGREFSYLQKIQNIDINKLIKKHSKYTRALLPTEVAY